MNLTKGTRYGLVVRVLVSDWDAGTDLPGIEDKLTSLGFVDVHASDTIPPESAPLAPQIAGATFKYAEATWPLKSRPMGGLLGDYQIVSSVPIGATSPARSSSTTAPSSSAAWWIPAGVVLVGVTAAIMRLRRKVR